MLKIWMRNARSMPHSWILFQVSQMTTNGVSWVVITGTVTKRRHSQTKELPIKMQMRRHNLKSSSSTSVSITVIDGQCWTSTIVTHSLWTHFKRLHKSWRVREFKNKRQQTRKPWWNTLKPPMFQETLRLILNDASMRTRQILEHFNLKSIRWSRMLKMRSLPITKLSLLQMWRGQSSQTQTRTHLFVGWILKMPTSPPCEVNWMRWWRK